MTRPTTALLSCSIFDSATLVFKMPRGSHKRPELAFNTEKLVTLNLVVVIARKTKNLTFLLLANSYFLEANLPLTNNVKYLDLFDKVCSK